MITVKIRKQFDDYVPIETACGSPIVDQFEWNEETHALEKVGEFNLQEYINSYLHDTDISMLVAKYKAGDVNALNRVQRIYGDCTVLPDHLGDYLNTCKAIDFAQRIKPVQDNMTAQKAVVTNTNTESEVTN